MNLFYEISIPSLERLLNENNKQTLGYSVGQNEHEINIEIRAIFKLLICNY